jgi:hypothetical protein
MSITLNGVAYWTTVFFIVNTVITPNLPDGLKKGLLDRRSAGDRQGGKRNAVPQPLRHRASVYISKKPTTSSLSTLKTETAITSKLRKQRTRLHGIISEKRKSSLRQFLEKDFETGTSFIRYGLAALSTVISTHTETRYVWQGHGRGSSPIEFWQVRCLWSPSIMPLQYYTQWTLRQANLAVLRFMLWAIKSITFRFHCRCVENHIVWQPAHDVRINDDESTQ